MSQPSVRALLAEAAIGIAVCCGAYTLVAEPVERALVAERVKEAALHQETHASQQRAAQAASRNERMASTLDWARRVDAASVLARDEAGMLGALMEHARQKRVRIDQIHPLPNREAFKPAGVDAAPTARTHRTAYSIRLEATFSDFVAFIYRGPDALGFMRIESISISAPSKPGSHEVQVTIQTEHLGFDVGAILSEASTSKADKVTR